MRHLKATGKGWVAGSNFLARRTPGGESFLQVRARIRPLPSLVRQRAIHGTVLVVAHYGSLRALLTVLLGLPEREAVRFTFGKCGMAVVTR